MTFRDAIANAANAWFSPNFADPITYNGVLIYGHVDYGVGEDKANANRCVIEVSVDDVPSPAYRDLVVIDAVSWRVYRDQSKGDVVKGDGVSWKIPLTRDERPVVTR